MNYSPIAQTTFNFKLLAIIPMIVLYLSTKEYYISENHIWLFLITPVVAAIIWILLKFQSTSKISYSKIENSISVQTKNLSKKYNVDDISNYAALFTFAGRGFPDFTIYNIDFVDPSIKYVRVLVLDDNIENTKTLGNLKYAITIARHKRVKNIMKKR